MARRLSGRECLADTPELRQVVVDDAFIGGMSAGAEEKQEWEAVGWSSAARDAGLAALPVALERMRLLGDLLAAHFRRYAQAVSGTSSFVDLDCGIAELRRHAKNVLEYDAMALPLGDLVL